MTDAAAPTRSLSATVKIPARSLGLKLLLVCGLALLMSIPAFFVFGLLMERTHRADQVSNEIGSLVGGPQTFLGPVIAVPWTAPPDKAGGDVKRGEWLVYPVTGRADLDTKASVRRRSLFEVPVYEAAIRYQARFDPAAADKAAKDSGITLDWPHAEFLTGASDARGAHSDVVLTIADHSYSLSPAAVADNIQLAGPDNPNPSLNQLLDRSYPHAANLTLFGMAAGSFVKPAQPLDVSGAMAFSGARRVGVLAFAKTTEILINGTWSSPSFDGAFLPASRSVAGSKSSDGGAPAKGFTARWVVPFIARGLPAQSNFDGLAKLGAAEVGVTFVEPANPYQSVGRSLKYALLFVGLVFLAYFMFETTTGKRVHPAQYVLIGLAQIIFYLLLLSISEHVGFDYGFLIAAGATVALISAYAGWVFESRLQGLRALAGFSLLYALIYVLMRLEDYALLVGALSSFIAIALVMYFTRRVD